MHDLDDTVNAAREGCPDAFSDLVRATYDDTYSLALRLVGNPEDAKDVAQDTYLRAFRGLSRFRGEANIASWLYRITSNCASSVLSRRRRVDHDELDLDKGYADPHPSSDPTAQAESSDLRDQVIGALGHLPEKLRSVIVLRDIYDLSHEAIAKQLGITENAAKVRLHRARQKLRDQLFGEHSRNDDDESDNASIVSGAPGWPVDRAERATTSGRPVRTERAGVNGQDRTTGVA